MSKERNMPIWIFRLTIFKNVSGAEVTFILQF